MRFRKRKITVLAQRRVEVISRWQCENGRRRFDATNSFEMLSAKIIDAIVEEATRRAGLVKKWEKLAPLGNFVV